jgi:hypothetical protein
MPDRIWHKQSIRDGCEPAFPVDERYQVPDQERTVGDAGRQFLSLWKKQPRCGKSNHCGPREALLSLSRPDRNLAPRKT